jgi:predicted site-specific integrase-resolvase
MTPDEVAKSLGISWSTAQGYLLKLSGEDKVSLAKKGRVNVFYLKSTRTARFNVPTWIKVRILRGAL